MAIQNKLLSNLLDLDENLDLEDIDPDKELYSKFKVVLVMSSSNIAYDKCSQALTFSIYNPEFQIKDRILSYFADHENPVEYIPNQDVVWDDIPPVSIVYSSYDYRKIPGIDEAQQIGHNKSCFFP